MVRPPPFRWSLLVPVAFVMVMPSVLAHGDEERAAPEPDVLWFDVRSVLWADWTNFTTYAPEGDGYVQAPREHVDRASWTWSASSVPERWVVPAGTKLRLIATLSGMEKTWPLALPYGNGTEPFATSFEGEAHQRGPSGTTPMASGETLVPMDPVHPPEGPLTVQIPMIVAEDTVLDQGDRFEVVLHVYARGVKYNSMRVHIGGEETASHIVVPGFPVASFRAWEEAYPHDVCLWHRSQGEPCPEARLEGPRDRETEAERQSESSPGVGVLWALLATVVWSWWGRRPVAP